MFKAPEWSLGLLIHPHTVTLIEAGQGFTMNEPALMARSHPKKTDDYGQQALLYPPSQQIYPFQRESFQVSGIIAFLKWLIQRLTPVHRCRILMPVANGADPIHMAFWHHIFQQLNVRKTLLLPVLECLKILFPPDQAAYVMHVEDGLVEMGFYLQGEIRQATTISYGRYLSRALAHQIAEQYQTIIDEATARSIWQRIGGLSDASGQVTVGGITFHGEEKRIMLVAEDVEPVFRAAFRPILAECRYQLYWMAARLGQSPLRERVERQGIWLTGRHATIPGLAEFLAQELNQEVTLLPNSDDALLNSVDRLLQLPQVFEKGSPH